MYIDIVPVIEGSKYRGAARDLLLPNVKFSILEKIYNLYMKYTDWYLLNNYIFSEEALDILLELYQLLTNSDITCEIILFNDTNVSDINLEKEFLGFDVFGDCCESPLQEGS